MDKLVLNKNEFLNIFKPLINSYEMIGPVKEDEKIYFRSVNCLDDIIWEFDNAINNIKDFFFPPRQVLYELKQSGVKKVVDDSGKKRIILLPHPCDVRALKILDKLFISDYEDQVYAPLRKNTIIMGLSCRETGQRCFCLSIGGSPFDIEGMDVSITDIDNDKFVIRIITDKAKDILDGKGEKAGKEELQNLERLKQRAEESIKRKIHIPDDIIEKFDSDYWRNISMACLKCGVCTYLCPTCHCFDIVDEGFLRIRCWDTCSSNTFTRMASGEDPRKEKFKRYRQRIYHKFSYYKDNFDEYACVGCGRCTQYCPVKIDIVEIVNNMVK